MLGAVVASGAVSDLLLKVVLVPVAVLKLVLTVLGAVLGAVLASGTASGEISGSTSYTNIRKHVAVAEQTHVVLDSFTRW